jgi:hypothetical protein
MTSSHDLPARPAGTASPALGPGRVRGRRVAALLAAAAPLAVAALASVPVATAHAAVLPAASTARPSQTRAAQLLTTTALPATTARTVFTDPKIPAAVGD